ILSSCFCRFFFFQAEDGIRDRNVTGVQTCALPISPQFKQLLLQLALDAAQLYLGLCALFRALGLDLADLLERADELLVGLLQSQIGRASCRERGWESGGQ